MGQPDSGGQARAFDRALGKTGEKVSFSPAEMGMAPVDLSVLVPGEPVPADLFLPIYKDAKRGVEMELGCSRGDVFQAKWRDAMLRNRQKRVFVRVGDARLMTDYFGANASKVIGDSNTGMHKKAHAIRELATLGLRLTFTSDLSPQALESCVGMAEKMVSQVTADPPVLAQLVQTLYTDFSIYTHSVNVSMVAMAYGRHLKYQDGRIHTLGMAGLLHDLGMAAIPKGIVDKQGPLSAEERKVMMGHTRKGYEMLKPVGSVSYDTLMITLHHHENADGSGYPGGLTAAKTPFLARLIRMIDAFAAITSTRPHRDRHSNYDAGALLLEEMQHHFGPDLVPSFIRFLGSSAL